MAPKTKNTIPEIWNFFLPITSDIAPSGNIKALVISELEIITQLTALRLTSNWSAIVGKANITIEKSNTIAKRAIATV